MNRHAKAPTAGSTERKTKRRLGGLLAILSLALCVLGSGASAASAATATMGTVKAFSTSAHVTGQLGNPVGDPNGDTLWRFDLSTDGGANWSTPDGGYTEAHAKTSETVETNLKGLTPGTQYRVRFVTVDLLANPAGEETISAVTPSFTTAPAITEAPTVLATDDASEVGFTSAKVSGEVLRPGGANEDPELNAVCNFEYITDAAYAANPVGERFLGATPVACNHNPLKAGDGPGVEATLTGLSAQTTYHLRILTSNPVGVDSKESTNTFATQSATAPVLVLNSAAALSASKAQIAGTIDPEGGNVDPIGPTAVPILWQLQYTLASEPGNWQLGAVGTIEGPQAESSTPIAVGPAQLSNLTPHSEYKFRLVASYAGKQAISSEGSFETAAVIAPTVTELAVSEIHGTSAHFSGKVNPNGTDPAFKSAWHFQCVPACAEPGGNVPAGPAQLVAADVSGLEPNSSYQVKLLASNPGGAGQAGPVSFATPKVAPMVQTGFATEVEATSATLNAKINPHNSEVSYQFEYGTDESYGTSTPIPAVSLADIDNANHEVTEEISGLQGDTTYHFRLAATNTESSETTFGEDRTFTTDTASGPKLCSNEQRRAENNSLTLPDCRAYELVTPLQKNGFDAGAVSGLPGYAWAMANGEGIFYKSRGPIGEANGGLQEFSVSRRSPAGWSTRAGIPHGSLERPYVNGHNPLEVMPSSDLSKLVFAAGGTYVADNPDTGSVNFSSALYMGHEDGSVDWLSRPQIGNPEPPPGSIESFSQFEPLGGSPDLSTVYFWSGPTLLPGDAARTSGWGLYEYTNGELKPAGTLPPTPGHPDGEEPSGGAAPASSGNSPRATNNQISPEVFGNQVSRDGSTLFFVSPDPQIVPGLPTLMTQLYVRRNGHSTLVSHAEDGTPAPTGAQPVFTLNGPASDSLAHQFAYASANGNVAIFQSSDALTSAAPNDSSLKSYRYEVATNTVTYLPGLAGATVVAASDDGSRFLVGRGGRGIALWDHNTIKTISSSAGLSVAPARATASGSVFIFSTDAPIPGFNSGGRTQVYRYDVAQGQTACLSCPPDGVVPSGDADLSHQNDADGNEKGNPLGNRGMSDDGKRVFFDSPDSLVPADRNSASDVYEWTPSGLSLITSGEKGAKGSYILDNSADGRDVFITSADFLDPRDTDSSYDVYDVRVGGGFAQVPAISRCAGNEVCKNASPPPPNQPGPTTNAFSGAGNPAPCPKGKVRQHGSCVKHKARKHKHHKKAHKKGKRTAGHGRGGNK